jgi:hypothetical protein
VLEEGFDKLSPNGKAVQPNGKAVQPNGRWYS